jgi:hypothetical protein
MRAPSTPSFASSSSHSHSLEIWPAIHILVLINGFDLGYQSIQLTQDMCSKYALEAILYNIYNSRSIYKLKLSFINICMYHGICDSMWNDILLLFTLDFS